MKKEINNSMSNNRVRLEPLVHVKIEEDINDRPLGKKVI